MLDKATRSVGMGLARPFKAVNIVDESFIRDAW